jgi:phosphate transport system permease protein
LSRTAGLIAGKASIEAGAWSSCRPPWFETMIPSTRISRTAVSKRDQSATVFGRTYSNPFGISPTGGVGLYRREGEVMLAQAAARSGHRVLSPAIEPCVGRPSIVYVYIGLVLLVPQLAKVAPPGKSGFGFGAAAIVLGVLVVPTIATLSADALQAVPSALREGSVALGATSWQTLWRVLIPAARPGIISGIVLGLARAMGEALAVALVIGGVARPPDLAGGLKFLVEPGMTMTTTITDGISDLGANPKAEAARYLLALVLLVITFICVTAVRVVQRRSEVIT